MKKYIVCPIVCLLFVLMSACGGRKPQPVRPTPQDSLARCTVQLDFMGIRIGQPFHQTQWERQHGIHVSFLDRSSSNDSTLAASFFDPTRNFKVSVYMLRDSMVYKVEAYLYDTINDSLWNEAHARYGNNAYQNKLYGNIFIVKHTWEFKNQRFIAYKNTTEGWEMMKFAYEDKALSERARKGSRVTTSTVAR
jgi:hypothetical protein